MPINAPSAQNIRNLFAQLNITHVYIGGEIYFGQDTPPPSGVSVIEVQPNALVGATTANVPIVGTNIEVGDTILVYTRSDTSTPTGATLVSGTPVFLRTQRTNGLNDTVSIWQFTASAGEAGVASFNMTINTSAPRYAGVIGVRGKAFTTVHNAVGVTAIKTLNVPATGVPNTSESLRVAVFNGATSNPSSVTDTTSNFPIDGDLGKPKTGMTGFVCMVDGGSLATGVVTCAPFTAGGMITGCWLN